MSQNFQKVFCKTKALISKSSFITFGLYSLFTDKMKWPKLKMSPALRENLLTILMICGVVAGAIVGLVMRSVANSNGNPWTQREVSYVNFLGELFLNMLKALILPLIASSLVAAVGSLDLGLSGKIGSRAVAYYLTTTVLAVILGIILVVTIQPGSRHSGSAEVESSISRNVTTTDTLMDLVRHMFPPNLVQACIQQYQTVLKPPPGNVTEPDLYKWKMSGSFENGTNILGVVVASIVAGIAISTLQRETANLLLVIREFNTMIMRVTSWVIWLSPIGVLFLVASKVLEIKDFGTIIGQLGLYFVTVAGGITFHGFVVLPIIFFVMTRKNPYSFIGRMGQAIATAFGTSSR
jgi:Na+/H+-dicarboxylate symporter